MKKFFFTLLLLITSLISSAEYRIMGYYANGAYSDYVIVYGYYTANGIFTMSHCRTNEIAEDIYGNKTYLDINTCTIRKIDQSETNISSEGSIPPPPPPPLGQKAF